MSDPIHNPAHYDIPGTDLQARDIIAALSLNHSTGNAMKYIIRAGRKAGETRLTALRKARESLDYEISREIEKESSYGN